MQKKQYANGFTLIELLIVIGIIGILSTLAIVALGSARTKARDAKRIADIKDVRSALELYFADYGRYPIAGEGLRLGSTDTACLDNADAGWASFCEDPYLNQVQADPGKYAYIYQSEDGANYVISFQLEGNIGTIAAGQVFATPSGIAN